MSEKPKQRELLLQILLRSAENGCAQQKVLNLDGLVLQNLLKQVVQHEAVTAGEGVWILTSRDDHVHLGRRVFDQKSEGVRNPLQSRFFNMEPPSLAIMKIAIDFFA